MLAKSLWMARARSKRPHVASERLVLIPADRKSSTTGYKNVTYKHSSAMCSATHGTAARASSTTAACTLGSTTTAKSTRAAGWSRSTRPARAAEASCRSRSRACYARAAALRGVSVCRCSVCLALRRAVSKKAVADTSPARSWALHPRLDVEIHGRATLSVSFRAPPL